ncbi:hypothetical protein [Varibaculum cambriense]|uniref:hypothetical protein n=1 Tax=Varibaculum cambriense TaxID=184870 RepID=UPI0028FEE0FC|nr:hypothetical protein [Varibaculum cambriense]MDU1225074.1 hypothetical protein [Varibaculum cambriense]
MFISLDEKFTDQAGNIYEVENPVDNHYITYLYDETGNKIIARSDESEDFPKFYKRGWSTQECHDSLKSDWVIQKDKQQHIEDLESHLDPGMDSWLCLEAWDKLPTEEAFADWVDTDFTPTWEDTGVYPDFGDEDRQRLSDSCDRLYKAMEDDPSIIQAVR